MVPRRVHYTKSEPELKVAARHPVILTFIFHHEGHENGFEVKKGADLGSGQFGHQLIHNRPFHAVSLLTGVFQGESNTFMVKKQGCF